MDTIKQIIKAPEGYYVLLDIDCDGKYETWAFPVYYMALVTPGEVLYPMVRESDNFYVEDGSDGGYKGLVHESKLHEYEISQIYK